MLDWVERRQTEMGRGSVYVAVPAANTRATRFYLGCGYRLERFSGWRGALLLGAFAQIHMEGLSSVELHVASDNPRAVDLYVGVGMSENERFDHYVRAP